MSPLVIIEHDNQHIHPASRNALAAALQLDSSPALLVAGSSCLGVAEHAATLAGAGTILYVDAPCFAHQLAENMSELIASLASSYTTLLASSSTFGKNLMPRVAALLDVAQVSDVSRIISQDVFEHPVYAGNAIETVKMLDSKKVLTIRSTAFQAVSDTQPACCIERVEAVDTQGKTEFVRQELTKSERPELGSAKIVVSGGRGLQSAEKFSLIEELADTLGAAVGASRAAVDAGFVPNDYQVGQTGKVVAPDLYMAIGISGAVQHLAGMKDSKVIVAINKDPDAPVFQVADYGLVGDLFEIVPQLIEQLRKTS